MVVRCVVVSMWCRVGLWSFTYVHLSLIISLRYIFEMSHLSPSRQIIVAPSVDLMPKALQLKIYVPSKIQLNNHPLGTRVYFISKNQSKNLRFRVAFSDLSLIFRNMQDVS